MKRREGISMAEVRAMIREMRSTLDTIEARLIRRSPTKRAKPTSARMTAKLRDAIRQMAEDSPEMTMSEIGARLRVNQGRVSEVLSGEAGANDHQSDEGETLPLPLGLPSDAAGKDARQTAFSQNASEE